MFEFVDDEDNSLLTPAFHVGDCSKVDTSKPPASGVDYLRRVHLETKKCPAVVVAQLDKQKLKKQTVTYTNDNGFTPAPPGLAPNLKLQRDQVASFSNLRIQLLVNRKKLDGHSPPVAFPDISDRSSWCKYCLGSEFLRKIDQLFKINRSTSENKEYCENGHDPLLSIMLHLPHSTVEKLLAYHLNWLRAAGFSENQGRWIFSLLALLEKPLRPETCDLLRHIARACATLRADITNEMDENLFALNHIISLISMYFGQKDMCENYFDNYVGHEDAEMSADEEIQEDTSEDDEAAL